jgi:hypothetical protein
MKQTTDKKQSLTFIKNGKMNDGKTPGVIYVHHFGTGYQELVFPSHEMANKFFNTINQSHEN